MALPALHRVFAMTSFLFLILTSTALAQIIPGAISAAGDAAKAAEAAKSGVAYKAGGEAATSIGEAARGGSAATEGSGAEREGGSAATEGGGEVAAEGGGEGFIRKSCSSCPYPDLCVSSLESHAGEIGQSPDELADTALSVSLEAARSADTGDCTGNVINDINDLKESLADMSEKRAMKIRAKIYGLQAWVTRALNDDDTCAEKPAESAVEESVAKIPATRRAFKVAQLTSNALTLVNDLVSSTQSAAPAASAVAAASAAAFAASVAPFLVYIR